MHQYIGIAKGQKISSMQNQVQLTGENKKQNRWGICLWVKVSTIDKEKNHGSTKGGSTPLRNCHTMGIGKGITGYFPQLLFARC
jgi:hypothetical protein